MKPCMFLCSVIVLFGILFYSCEEDLTAPPQRISYGIGFNLGQRARFDYDRANITVDYELVVQGFKDGLMKNDPPIPVDQLMQEIESYFLEKQSEINMEKGTNYRKMNKARRDVEELASGIQYRIIIPGAGPKPKPADTVVCHYQVTSVDGDLYQSSYMHGEPVEFGVDGVIQGWTEILQLMPIGSKWEVVIPPELAYGANGSAEIGPYETLVFEIELLEIKGNR
ncbi:MAG: FKBP-type peptidyl-prolyl cis-trans isomerase [Spirochaetales bacterium]|nr:FKBP-type peptidyl-prolyl cis-trans isomerase [Spirochaetales bacterium]